MENDPDGEFMAQFRKTRKIFEEMGIDPEQLEERIADLEATVSQLLYRVQKLDKGVDPTEISAIAALNKLK